MIKVGIIGCGRIAQVRHIPEYVSNPNATIAGYYDFVYERAKEMADKFGGKAYATMEELLSVPEIGAVSVCVANHAHASVTIQALEANKDVLCEKPMAVTIEECEKMVETANKMGRKLMIGQNQRFAKAHMKAKELIAAGCIGDIVTFKTCFGHSGPDYWSVDSGTQNWFFQKDKSSLGALADLGVHKTDLIQYLLDSKVNAVQAKIITLDKCYEDGSLVDVDDNAICIYHMDNGAVGTMTASWTYYGGEDNSTILYGTQGMMKLYCSEAHSIEILLRNGEKVFYDLEAISTNDTQNNSGIIDSFVHSLVTDTRPEISGEDVLYTMKVIFAAVESAEKGREIQVS